MASSSFSHDYPEPVEERNVARILCTEYSDRRQPSLRAMEEIAWVLRSGSKKNTIGFVKRTELTRRERFVLDDDDLSQDSV